MIKKILVLALLQLALTVSAEPRLRVVCTDGVETEFAVDDVHKLMLSEDNVEVVGNDGLILLNGRLNGLSSCSTRMTCEWENLMTRWNHGILISHFSRKCSSLTSPVRSTTVTASSTR